MPRLTVVHGPQNSGKIAEVWRAAAEDPKALVVHRDTLRVAFGRRVDEDTLTALMLDVAACFLGEGHSVVTAAPDMLEADAFRWRRLAAEEGAELEWIETA